MTSNPVTTHQSRDAERRQHSRHDFHTEIGLELFLTDDRVVTCEGPVWLVDVSLRGLKVHVESLDYEIYRELMRRQRVVKVYLDDGQGGARLELQGTGVWIDYHRADGSSQHGSLNMGIHLKKTKDGMPERFQRFIDRRI